MSARTSERARQRREIAIEVARTLGGPLCRYCARMCCQHHQPTKHPCLLSAGKSMLDYPSASTYVACRCTSHLPADSDDELDDAPR